MFFLLALVLSSIFLRTAYSLHLHRAPGGCTPFHTTFADGSVARRGSHSSESFVSLSPDGSYEVGSGGLQLFMQKPRGKVTKSGGVNDKLADGATVNSTFLISHGKVTFEVIAPTVAGVVTAMILIADEHDELDVELLGADPKHWQTNVYAPSPSDTKPLWGVFGSVEDFPSAFRASVGDRHLYTIDWSAERVQWSVDGHVLRTLTPEQTRKGGKLHYPAHAARIQLGIWDASSPQGTAEWAHWPIKWDDAPGKITAIVKSVSVECPTKHR